ncbi:hypothetical protein F4777DRAFT_532307 [Nemania sp. FL0916]|nr:hypothetical protein F4777DRAFT_532307 [Nemania sp. FL0916]
MASNVVTSISATATITVRIDTSITSLLVTDGPCSDIHLHYCEAPESCAALLLPSALCWVDTRTKWSISRTPSCTRTGTDLTVPVVTSSCASCPTGMTLASVDDSREGNWCCPIGFTLDTGTARRCHDTLAQRVALSILSSCIYRNSHRFTSSSDGIVSIQSELLVRHERSRLIAESFPVPSVLGRAALSDIIPVTVFAEAVSLEEQTQQTTDLLVPPHSTSNEVPSASGDVNDGRQPDTQSSLPTWAKVAIGVGSGSGGLLLLLLGILLVRKHRKRQLASAAQAERLAAVNHDDHSRDEPTSRRRENTNRAIWEHTAIHHESRMESPGEPRDDFQRLCIPDTQEQAHTDFFRGRQPGKKTTLEIAPISFTTYLSTNQTELIELEGSPVTPKTPKRTRLNTRASSQVFPQSPEMHEYWSPSFVILDHPTADNRV